MVVWRNDALLNTVSWLILILYWMSATVITRENSLVRTAADTQKKVKIKQEKVDGRGRGEQGGRRYHEALVDGGGYGGFLKGAGT